MSGNRNLNVSNAQLSMQYALTVLMNSSARNLSAAAFNDLVKQAVNPSVLLSKDPGLNNFIRASLKDLSREEIQQIRQSLIDAEQAERAAVHGERTRQKEVSEIAEDTQKFVQKTQTEGLKTVDQVLTAGQREEVVLMQKSVQEALAKLSDPAELARGASLRQAVLESSKEAVPAKNITLQSGATAELKSAVTELQDPSGNALGHLVRFELADQMTEMKTDADRKELATRATDQLLDQLKPVVETPNANLVVSQDTVTELREVAGEQGGNKQAKKLGDVFHKGRLESMLQNRLKVQAILARPEMQGKDSEQIIEAYVGMEMKKAGGLSSSVIANTVAFAKDLKEAMESPALPQSPLPSATGKILGPVMPAKPEADQGKGFAAPSI